MIPAFLGYSRVMPWVEQLPSGKYRARYYLPDGSKRTVKEHFTHKRRAQNAAIDAEAKASAPGWRDPRAAEKTWKEWCDEWWPTRPVEPGVLKRDMSSRDSCLLPKWGSVQLVDITRHDIKAWAAELRKGGMAPSTVKKRVYLLSASLSAAVDAEVLTVNPAYRINLPGGQTDRRRYLTRAEASRLMAQFNPPVKHTVGTDLVPMLFGTGMRWGEAVGLQIERVNLKRSTIRIAEVWDDETRQLKKYPKGRRIREVPIPSWVMPHLVSAIAGRSTGFVFLSNGVPIHHSNWRNRVWVPAVRRTGLGRVVIHDTRHTYASWLIQGGVSLAEVGRLLGHVSPATTQIYAHLADVPREQILSVLFDPATPVSPQLS